MQRTLTIGLTGPSTFTENCCDMIEEFFNANFVMLYQTKQSNVESWLKQVDGVILAGGVDIHPTVYGESLRNDANLSKFDIERDCRELNIINYCLEKQIPMLGICRGHQLLGIRYRLPFIMDISCSPTIHSAYSQKIAVSPKEPSHCVIIRKEYEQYFFGEKSCYQMPEIAPERLRFKSTSKNCDKGKKIWVNSFHHQALAYLPSKIDYNQEGINVIGTGAIHYESCPEIIELMDSSNWVSCQWHPEFDWRENTASKVILNRFKSLLENR